MFNLSRSMLRKYKTSMFSIVLLLAFLGIVFYFSYMKKAIPEGIREDDVMEKGEVDRAQERKESILIEINDVVKWVNVENGKLEDASDLEGYNFSGFSFNKNSVGDEALPNESSALARVLFSSDKKKAALTFDIFKGVDFEEPIRTDEYLCYIAEKRCNSSQLLFQGYESDAGNMGKSNSNVWWEAWDSDRNELIGYSQKEDGNLSSIYACSPESKKCRSNSAFSQNDDARISITVPNSFISPSMDKFAVVSQLLEEDDLARETWEVMLYETGNLDKPLKVFDLSGEIRKVIGDEFEQISSIAWSVDEKKLAIGMDSGIYILDLEDVKLQLVHRISADENEDRIWDSSSLVFSPDYRYLVFAGFSAASGVDEDTDEEITDVLQKIDLQDGNKVSELIKGDSVTVLR